MLDFQGEGLSRDRLNEAVDAAREAGFRVVSANDHFLFSAPWLDGPTALAAASERAGDMELATSISLAVLRGPVPLAKALAAIDVCCEGRLTAGVGPGSSKHDYDALGVPYAERWARLDEAVLMTRALLRGEVPPVGEFYNAPDAPLEPRAVREEGVPIWIASWGSSAGIRRVARIGDGWLASAYNTTPAGFEAALRRLEDNLAERGRDPASFPNALATMWTWVTEDSAEAERILREVLAPLLRRDPEQLRGQVCVGSAAECSEIVSAYARAGCQRVHFWPLGAERRQLETLATEVFPALDF